tara:strand:+ start:291 stop:563 length:273 start_codon:yes stop_codon:yes gene_type:complete
MKKKICKNCKELNNIIEDLENIIDNLENVIDNLEKKFEINQIKKNSISIVNYIKYLHLKEIYNNEELQIIKYTINKKERLNKEKKELNKE